MKMRWLKTIKTEYVPIERNSSMLDTIGRSPYFFPEPHYKKQQRVERKLQYFDSEFSQWVDVEEVVVNEGEK